MTKPDFKVARQLDLSDMLVSGILPDDAECYWQMAVVDDTGREYTYTSPRVHRKDFLAESKTMIKLVELVERIMRGDTSTEDETDEKDRGIVTLGTWRIRGDKINAFQIVPMIVEDAP